MQRQYLTQVVQWARGHSPQFEDHWGLFEQLMQQGSVSVAANLHREAEGLYNLVTGVLFLSEDRLRLDPAACTWAQNHGDHPLVRRGKVDISSVIVHETSHALRARQRGRLAALDERAPYQDEYRYLQQLALQEIVDVRPAARERAQDLCRDALEKEGIQLTL